MRQQSRSLLLSLVFLLFIFSAYYFIFGQSGNIADYDYGKLMEDLSEDRVSAIRIHPNTTSPTGDVDVYLVSGNTARFNVLDVVSLEETVRSSYPSVAIEIAAVRGGGIFVTSILPVLMMGLLVLFLIMMMNRQGGGANAKMMNFG